MQTKLEYLPKALKTIQFEWNALLKRKNFIRPTTRNEYQEQFNKKALSFEVDYETWFLHENYMEKFKEIVSKFYSAKLIREDGEIFGLSDVLSQQTIAQILHEEIEFELMKRADRSGGKRSFLEIEENVQSSILSKIDFFDFIFIVKGIRLRRDITLDFENPEMFIFEQRDMNLLIENHPCSSNRTKAFQANGTSTGYDFSDHIRSFSIENLVDEVCVRTTAYGEHKIAERRAYKQTKEVINYFRFISCLLLHERIPENRIKIGLTFETYSNSQELLSIRDCDDSIVLAYGSGRDRREQLPVDRRFYKRMVSEAFLTDFIEIINAQSQTPIEECILTAIYWVGEAQNEFDLDVAFLKYWTAIECIFTGSKEKYFSGEESITKDLVSGVTRISSFYLHLSEPKEVQKIRTEITKLYDKRSKIIHAGMNYLSDQVIDEIDVSKICKYSAWSILILFDMRANNCKTKEECAIMLNKIGIG